MLRNVHNSEKAVYVIVYISFLVDFSAFKTVTDSRHLERRPWNNTLQLEHQNAAQQ